MGRAVTRMKLVTHACAGTGSLSSPLSAALPARCPRDLQDFAHLDARP
jgi:hypothetical protein